MRKISFSVTLLLYGLSCFAQTNSYVNSYWTWAKGDSSINNNGVYGNKGVSSATNKPGGRQWCTSWTDKQGNLWLFGGTNAGVGNYFNDLWKYDISTNGWTWTTGDSVINVFGVYGTKSVASVNNKPGGRTFPVSWVDASGELWLFGGLGYAASTGGNLNDLWKYNTFSSEWVWVSGDSISAIKGIYGTRGVTAAGNKPGGRYGCATWKDTTGNLWLMGGFGNGNSVSGNLDDLWKYNISTGMWTWVKGDSSANVNGVYGTKGVAAPGNKPGGREYSTTWTDVSGNFWLLGGFGYSATGSSGILNDLWKYDPAGNQWTWMKGDSVASAKGVYGNKGIAASTNKPGGRYRHVSWTDASGNFWIFGGLGFGATNGGDLNDLWKYNPPSDQWTWVSGDSIPNVPGVYGTTGTAASGNKPGGRLGAVSWADPTGNFWLFGGNGYGKSNTAGFLNDLWNVYGGATNIFNGNGDWNLATNWIGNVIAPKNIPAGIAVIIDHISSGQCNDTGNINIQYGGKLTINPAKTLVINNGNLANFGSLNGSGTVSFSGGLSALSSSGSITTPLELVNKQIFLTGTTNTRSIALYNGSHIRLDSFDLKMDTGVLVNDNPSYIITNGSGKLYRKGGAGQVLFPVGPGNADYNPLTISINSNSNSPASVVGEEFGVRVTPGVLTRQNVAPITVGAVNKTWQVTKSNNGSSNLRVTAQWTAPDELPGFDRNAAFLAKVCPPPPNCNGGFDVSPSAAVSGSGPYTITRDSVTLLNAADSFIVRTCPVVYTFTGSGSWTNAANWYNGLVPGNIITSTMEVIIDPPLGICDYPGDIIVQAGGKLTVQPNKILRVAGNIIIQ